MCYESDTLPSYRRLRKRSYTIILKLKYYPGYSTSCPTYLSHHLMNPMVQIFSTLCAYFIYGTVGDVRYKGGMLPTNVFFDGTQTCHIQGFFHWWPFLPAAPSKLSFLSRRLSGYTMINIYPVTTHLSLPYSNTVWACALFIINRVCSYTPVFLSNSATITHLCQSFLIFWHGTYQLLLLYVTVQPRYDKDAVVFIISRFKLMNTLLDSKQCWRVSHKLRRSPPSQNWS